VASLSSSGILNFQNGRTEFPADRKSVQWPGADKDRFEKESSFCILCGLCVRYCAEVKKKNAVEFVECGARREIRLIPEIAAKECLNCKACFELCPTSYLQAAFVLTGSLGFSRDSR
jgi:bidirectional [NiFe] hydrogenase diaphorase subunit